MWVWIVIGVVLIVFLLVLACLRVAKQSEEQYCKTESDRKLYTLFACAHLVVQVQVHSLRQSMKNQGYGRDVMEALEQDAKCIHSMIDSNHYTVRMSDADAYFYLNNEQGYQRMLKTLVGYMSDIDGYEQGQKCINEWIQFHDDWIRKYKSS